MTRLSIKLFCGNWGELQLSSNYISLQFDTHCKISHMTIFVFNFSTEKKKIPGDSIESSYILTPQPPSVYYGCLK